MQQQGSENETETKDNLAQSNPPPAPQVNIFHGSVVCAHTCKRTFAVQRPVTAQGDQRLDNDKRETDMEAITEQNTTEEHDLL